MERELFTLNRIWINPINPFKVPWDKPIKYPQCWLTCPIKISIHTCSLIFIQKTSNSKSNCSLFVKLNLFEIRKMCLIEWEWERKGALPQCHNVIPNLTKIFDEVNSVPLVRKCGKRFYLFDKREMHNMWQSKYTLYGQRVMMPKYSWDETCLSHSPVSVCMSIFVSDRVSVRDTFTRWSTGIRK